MLSLLPKFIALYSWFQSNRASIVLFLMAILAGATAFTKLLELLVAGVAVVFPEAAKTETFLNKVLSAIDAFAHSKFLLTLQGAPKDRQVTLASKSETTQPGVAVK